MANILIEYNTMVEIADSIRAMTGTTSKLKPGEMPVVINNAAGSTTGEDTLGAWLSGNMSSYRIAGENMTGSMLNTFYSGPPITLDCYEATSISGTASPGNNCTILMPLMTEIPAAAFYSFKHLDIPNVVHIEAGALNSAYGTVNLNTEKILYVGNNGLRAGSFSEINFPNCETFGVFNYAYNNGVRSINLPKVDTAYVNHFYSDYYLTSVDMPLITDIPRYMFYGCGQYAGATQGLMQFNNVITIHNNAFEHVGGNGACIDIRLPNCTTINSGAFYSCGNGATHTLYAPNVVNIGINAFTYANGFIELNFPSLVEVNPRSFTYAYQVKSLQLENAVNISSGSGSSLMPNLTSLYIPNAIDIGAYAFNASSNLTKLNATSVKNIEYNAFGYLNKLTEINMPNVTFINTNAFSYANSRTVKFGESVPTATPNFNGTPLYGANISALFLYYNSVVPANIVKNANISLGIFVPDDMLSLYKANSAWSSYNVFGISEYDTKNVGDIIFLGDSLPDAAYYSNSNIYTFVGDNVTTIGNNAFMSTYKLYSIKVPNVVSIGDGVFCYGALTEDLVMPKLTSTGNNAFYYCNAPGIIVNSLQVAAPNAFQYANFANIQAPSMTDVQEGGFYYCGAPNIYTPSVVNISNNGYYQARPITGYIEAPINVGVNGLSSVTGIKINSLETLQTADTNAFASFNGILPSPLRLNALENASSGMFYYSSAVPSDIYATNLVNISQNAFRSCNNIVNFYGPNVVNIASNAFAACQKLMNLYVPNAAVFGQNMLQDCWYSANNGLKIHCDALVEVHNGALYSVNNTAAIVNLNWANLTYIGQDAFGSAIFEGHTANECPKLEYCYQAGFIDTSNDIVLPNIKGLGSLGASNINMYVPNATTFGSSVFVVTPNTYLYAPSATSLANYAVSCTEPNAVANVVLDYANMTYLGYAALNFNMSDADLLAVLNSGATTTRPFLNGTSIDCNGADISINLKTTHINATWYQRASVTNVCNLTITPSSTNAFTSIAASNIAWVGNSAADSVSAISSAFRVSATDTVTYINGAYPAGLVHGMQNCAVYDCTHEMTFINVAASGSIYSESKLKNLTLINCTRVPNIYNCKNLATIDLTECNAVCAPSNMYNTQFNNGTGNIYVPTGLLEAYKADNNWIARGTNVINCISTK